MLKRISRVMGGVLALVLIGQLAVPVHGQCEQFWRQVGGGVDATVRSLAVFDDGTGPALYVGGLLNHAGGLPCASIARWNGTDWAALDGGLSYSLGNSWVNTQVVFDDGSGPALYVGGRFDQAGGQPANNIARWDGTAWAPLGAGIVGTLVNAEVNALAVFDDGSGPALYAAGEFDTAGGQPARNIARWNGTTWSALTSSMTGGVIRALAVYDSGNGPALYAAGSFFFSAAGGNAQNIARWNGFWWSPLGGGLDSFVTALAVFDDGTGAALYVGGILPRRADSRHRGLRTGMARPGRR
ncbi:MAG: hypothetical protein IPM18_06855 [Phycisphaerales bacterium]|nr:hypothetical protein [Phycisphaerales bacterium]